MVSEFRFPDWAPVLAAAQRIAPRVARLRARCASRRIPVIYVNDATGTWEADRTQLQQRCLLPSARGREVVRQIAPAANDLFIFKPRHSAFYATPLAEVLARLGVQELILTGVTSHQCVLFSAMDAYVRNLDIIVPRDCIGAPAARQTRQALFVLQEALQARITESSRLQLR